MTTRIRIQGRLAFPVLDKPKAFEAGGTLRYSGNVIVEPNSEALKAIKKAMRSAAAGKWGEAKADKALEMLTKSLKTCLLDGDSRDYDGYAGNWVVTAHAPANQPPELFKTEGGRNVRLDNTNQSVIYGGCVVNVILDFWAQDNQYGKRINAQLCGLQFVRDGDPFGGGRPASANEFEVVEEAEGVAFGDDDDDVSF